MHLIPINTITMNKEYFHSNVYEKIKDYIDREKAEADNFQVCTMTITPELAEKINKYIRDKNLSTYSQSRKNKRQVRFLYTPNFSVKMYVKYNGGYSMCLIDSGASGHYSGKYREDEYKEKAEKSMTQLDLYFAIIKKYPNHLLDISFVAGEDANIPF